LGTRTRGFDDKPNLFDSFAPLFASFVERLIGTIRRDYLDQLFFWNTHDLQHKLNQFRDYFNEHSVHAGIKSDLPNQQASKNQPKIASFENYSWESHRNGLFQIPKAARLTIR
jgi:putative transposase